MLRKLVIIKTLIMRSMRIARNALIKLLIVILMPTLATRR